MCYNKYVERNKNPRYENGCTQVVRLFSGHSQHNMGKWFNRKNGLSVGVVFKSHLAQLYKSIGYRKVQLRFEQIENASPPNSNHRETVIMPFQKVANF